MKRNVKGSRPNTNVTQHFHPRWLARAIVHNRLEQSGYTGVNKVVRGAKQSPFARNWRNEAELVAGK